MQQAFWILFCFLLRSLMRLRYRITIRGMETLQRLKEGEGTLFMPNHPAHMDPLMVVLLLWPRYRMRPLAIEYIYRQPWMRKFMNLVKALPIPNFETSVNQIKIKKAEQTIAKILEGLKQGDRFLLYPAGRLKNSGKEILGGASAAHTLLSEAPESNVVLIRTTGLWGSSFSKALTGRSPDLKKTIAKGIWTCLKNFIFFMPRRNILIEIEAQPEGLPRGSDRVAFNRYLENWYNRYKDEQGHVYEAEPLRLVSTSCWKEELPAVYQPRQRAGHAGAEISSQTQAKIYSEILRIIEKPTFALRPEMNLAFDLGMDSLQLADLISFVGQHFEMQEIHPEELHTVQDVLEVAEGARLSEKPIHQEMLVHWPKESLRPVPMLPLGKTIPEAFLRCADRMNHFTACGDDLVGVFSYAKLKRAALVLAQEFKRMDEERIGVLLPASVGAFIVILAIQFAGKVPVMLNWTLGSKSLDEMVKTAELKTVISSWRFLERLSHVDFGAVTDMVQLLEDIRENLSLSSKLRGAFLALQSAKRILFALKLHRLDPNSPAVILFTSGTEAAPKGVPLSHQNIVSNLRSGMQCISLTGSDVLYGILPPFHSFGFSVAGLFALLGGVKIAFYPDPTDSFALAEGVERWKATLFCSAPSFLKGLLTAAKPEQLSTIRYFITGAEKTRQELYDRVEALHTGAKIIEGYGITECAPIITINRPTLPPAGVGKPLPDVKLCTIHPETLQLLPYGKEGEICVKGPNVFNGYLGNPRSPFIYIGSERWYRTGDIGYLDEHENLILSGRLKRFTKIGGEMISLGGIEEVLITELLKQGKVSSDLPTLAVCAEEHTDGRQPQLVLFTTIQIDKDAVNEILRRSGLSRLVKISAVQQMQEIPLLGTGKTDYRRLQQTLTA